MMPICIDNVHSSTRPFNMAQLVGYEEIESMRTFSCCRNLKNEPTRSVSCWQSVEVRYKNLCVQAECEVVHGKPLPTLWNSLANITILNDMSGVIKPGRPLGVFTSDRLKRTCRKAHPTLPVTSDMFSFKGAFGKYSQLCASNVAPRLANTEDTSVRGLCSSGRLKGICC